MTVRLLLVDDHALLREGLRLILAAHRDLEVVGETGSGLEAVELAASLAPDLVLMDIQLPDLDGIAATRRILAQSGPCQVIVLSMHADREHVYLALQAGARGYLLKESAGSDVVDAVLAVSRGRRFLSSRITDTVVGEFLRDRPLAATSPLDSLSGREREVLQLVVAGRSSAEIGGLLKLSPKTVDTYRSRLMTKLGVHDVAGLVKLAVQHGLTD